MNKKNNWLVAVSALVLLFGLVHSAQAALVALGPPNSSTTSGLAGGIWGFPLWFEDSNNLRLELCLPNAAEIAAGACLAVPPNPGNLIAFPTNFPGESFWFASGALIALPGGGQARLDLAMEAAFLPTVADGNQNAFGRVRFRVDVPPAGGTYTVRHPYGVYTEDVPPGGVINFTEDIGGTGGSFAIALTSNIGPFLRPSLTPGGAPLPLFDGSALRPGALYLIDPAVVDTFVTGAVLPNLNEFRVDGPNIGGVGINTIFTDRFTLQGRLFSGRVPTSLSGVRATYSRPAVGTGFVEVLANSAATAVLTIRDATGDIPTTTMLTDPGTGRFTSRIPITPSTILPASLTVTADNTVSNPLTTPTTLGANLTDLVTVTLAEHDPFTRTLTIQAASSDQVSSPILTATGFGPLVSGKITVNNVISHPGAVTVTSSLGGSGTRDIISVPPVSDLRATYCRPAVGNGLVTVFATSSPTATLTISDPTGRIPATIMDKDPNTGAFFAQIPLIPTGSTTLPAILIITATSPTPGIAPESIGVDLKDVVTITLAEYIPLAKTFSILANSCDVLAPPVLTAVGFGDLSTSGFLTIKNLNAPPSIITVNSSVGGSDSKEVTTGNLRMYLPAILK